MSYVVNSNHFYLVIGCFFISLISLRDVLHKKKNKTKKTTWDIMHFELLEGLKAGLPLLKGSAGLKFELAFVKCELVQHYEAY